MGLRAGEWSERDVGKERKKVRESEAHEWAWHRDVLS